MVLETTVGFRPLSILRELFIALILLLGALVYTAPLEGNHITLEARLFVGISAMVLAIFTLSASLRFLGGRSEHPVRDAVVSFVPMSFGLSAFPFLGPLFIPLELIWAANVLGERWNTPFLSRLGYIFSARLAGYLAVFVAAAVLG